VPTWEQRSDIVTQAAGMVSVQADCTLDEAIELIENRAALNGKTREETATAIIEREIRFGLMTTNATARSICSRP
jgi:hypothetical protein